MKNTIIKHWIYLPYLCFSAFLILGREQFIDEAWYTYATLTFQQGGVARDFAWCGSVPPYRLLFEPTSIVLSGWYSIGNLDIVWGRILSVIAGLLFLVVINRCLSIIGIPRRVQQIAIVVGGSNYFLLLALSQIRPEGLALLATGGSLFVYLCWQKTQTRLLLILAHLFIIFASLFHWQAAFTAIALWISMAFIEREKGQAQSILPIFLLYAIFVMIYLIRIFSFWDGFRAELQWQFAGNMAGHRGGILALLLLYAQTMQFSKFFSMVVFVGALGTAILLFLLKDKSQGRVTVSVFGFAGYISWLATTGAGDDYHAAWLTIGIIMAIIASVEMFQSSLGVRRLAAIGLLMVPLLLTAYGWFFAIKTIVQNPRIQVFERDLAAFDAEFQLKQTTVWGDRQTMWYFGFDWKGGDPPEYFVSARNPAPDSISICQVPYVFVKRGLAYTLYQRTLR